MPGKLRITHRAGTVHAHLPKAARAFCEGMAFRMTAGPTLAPQEDNPYPADPMAEEAAAWDDGWIHAELGEGDALDPLGCALPPDEVPADPA